jgi:hypothetical protein
MFRSQLYDHPQGSSFVLSAATAFPFVCFVQFFVRYVAICCLCVFVFVLAVCGMSGDIDNMQPHTEQTTGRSKQAEMQ